MASSIIKLDETVMEDDTIVVDDSKINNTVKLSKENLAIQSSTINRSLVVLLCMEEMEPIVTMASSFEMYTPIQGLTVLGLQVLRISRNYLTALLG